MKRKIGRAAQGIAVAFAFALAASVAQGAVKTKTIEYEDAGTTLKGVLAWDDAAAGKRPGVLVVHEWWGLNDYAKGRAVKLAQAGYVAFALDMYGDDKVTRHGNEAGEWMNQIASNVEAWRARANAGLAVLKAQPQVDAANVAAIGYCFGGATVMQMAYAGAGVKAVVSFHGSLPPAPDNVTSIKPRVMVAHGRDDAFIPAEQIDAFQKGLDRAGAEWEMTIYSGARHAFTNPDAGSYGIDNLAYNKVADARSWAAMMGLFRDVFH